jgi:glycosyltransferase involved in cell wall biosynthesis
LECAAAGVPCIVYGDYGADEWITTGKDGYVVNTFDEAKAVIEDLIANPNKVLELSKNAIDLGKKFDWKVVIKEWENEIDKIISIK